MATVKIQMKDYARYMRQLGQNLQKAVMRGIVRGAGESISSVLKPATEQAVPASARGGVGAFDTGAYMRGWKATPLPNGARIYNEAPYAGIIERGRRPGARQPPTQALIPWIRAKIPIQKKQSRRKAGPAPLRKKGRTVDEAKALAFVIARAIGQRGLKGRYVLAKSVPKIRDLIQQRILEELEAALARTR